MIYLNNHQNIKLLRQSFDFDIFEVEKRDKNALRRALILGSVNSNCFC
jgi:hypothetical protein